MTWETILKQIRRKQPIRMAGGSKADDMREEELDMAEDFSLDTMFEPMAEEELANATREDIITELEYYIKGLSKEDLLKILVQTRGDIQVKDMPFR